MTADDQVTSTSPDAREQGGEPRVIDEIEVEDLTVDGICGVY